MKQPRNEQNNTVNAERERDDGQTTVQEINKNRRSVEGQVGGKCVGQVDEQRQINYGAFGRKMK